MQDSRIPKEIAIEKILKEDGRRRAAMHAPYDPVAGDLSPGTRFAITIPELSPSTIHIPVAMRETPEVKALLKGESLRKAFGGSLENARRRWMELRCRYDFPFWAYKCIKIKIKGSCLDSVPFLLNSPQRKLIGEFEKMREEGLPIRIILVKARQWGGSTATQIYILWIQLMRRPGFNSLIIGHQNSGSEEVITMAKRALDRYPRFLLQGDGDPMTEKEKVYVNSTLSRNVITVPRRNIRIKAGSAERPDACRGGDYALVHLTEVGLWRKTLGKRPEDIMRAATSGVLLEPETVIVMESTANGTGTFFHKEYLAAKRGTSLYRPVFVAWYEIEKYAQTPPDRRKLAERLLDNKTCSHSDDDREASGSYLWSLWEAGASLDAIYWYDRTRRGHSDPDQMPSEYPSDDEEAFVNSGAHVFNRGKALALKADCRPPHYSGELEGRSDYGPRSLEGITFEEDPNGRLKIWEMPETEGRCTLGATDRYLTVVDVGGRSVKADWSVIVVFDCIGMLSGRGPAVAAQWRGHCDMDQLAWLSARIARWYGDSLLVIESNTLETRDPDRYVDGDQSAFILDQIRDSYSNLYARRQSPEDIIESRPRKYGFHTNVCTKPMVISNLVRVVREGLYVERDERCIDEYLTYERRRNGSYGAITGKHDDMLMTRAIGLHICFNEMTPPRQADNHGHPAGILRPSCRRPRFW